MPFEVIRETVENILDHRLVSEDTGCCAEPGEKGAAERIAGKEAVQIASHHAAIGADCTVGMAAEVEHRPRETRPGGHAEMHLVAPHRHAGRDLMAGRLSQPLVAAEHGVDVEQP